MILLEVYCYTILTYYACCATALMCAKSTHEYTRSKDIKNACTSLETKIKNSALMWGPVWPAWLVKLWLRK